MPGQKTFLLRDRAGPLVRIRQNHLIELQSLGVLQLNEKDALRRQLLIPADQRRRALPQQLPHSPERPPVLTDHRDEAALILCLSNSLPEQRRVFRVISARPDHRLKTRPLHRSCLQLLVLRQKPGEQRRDLRRGAVACLQRQLHRFFSTPGKNLVNPPERNRPLPDRLKLVSQQHKPRVRKILCERHELSLGVILHLVNHDILRHPVAFAGQRHPDIEPLDGGEVLLPENPFPDVLIIEPAVLPDHLERAAVIVDDLVLLRNAEPVVPGRSLRLCRSIPGPPPRSVHLAAFCPVLPVRVVFHPASAPPGLFRFGIVPSV